MVMVQPRGGREIEGDGDLEISWLKEKDRKGEEMGQEAEERKREEKQEKGGLEEVQTSKAMFCFWNNW